MKTCLKGRMATETETRGGTQLNLYLYPKVPTCLDRTGITRVIKRCYRTFNSAQPRADKGSDDALFGNLRCQSSRDCLCGKKWVHESTHTRPRLSFEQHVRQPQSQGVGSGSMPQMARKNTCRKFHISCETGDPIYQVAEDIAVNCAALGERAPQVFVALEYGEPGVEKKESDEGGAAGGCNLFDV
jgi:hypothetical protein